MNMFVFSFTLKVILRSTTDDEQFSVECRKWFGIALSLVDSAVWLVQNIRPTLLTNQITYWILPRPRHLCFLVPQEVCLFFTLFLSFLSDIFLYPDWTQSAWVVFCFRHSIEERLNISTSYSFTFRLQWKLSEKNQDFQNLSFHNEIRLIACWIRRCLVGKRWLFQVTAIQLYINCFQVLIFEFSPTGQSRFDV